MARRERRRLHRSRAHARTDEEVVAWLRKRTDESTYPAINERLSARGIRDEQHFQEVLPRYPVLREHPRLRNWFEILDLDDRWIFDPANAAKAKPTAPGS